jgi:hypothetical protein
MTWTVPRPRAWTHRKHRGRVLHHDQQRGWSRRRDVVSAFAREDHRIRISVSDFRLSRIEDRVASVGAGASLGGLAI